MSSEKIVRHARIDRWFHWLTAIAMTLLLLTSLSPIFGWNWPWYGVHWVAGIVLTLVILLHIVRALFWQRPGAMLLLSARDFSAHAAGKYTLAQKLMHLGWTVAVLVAIVTGLLLLKKAGVPFLTRDPYVYSLDTWGVLTVLHDLSALLTVFLILVHVYFAVLPEKRAYLRAMVSGGITRSELAAEHDVERVERGE